VATAGSRAGLFWSATARRPKNIGGGGAARRGVGRQKCFSKVPENISFYPKNFLMTFFSYLSKIATK